MGKVEHELHKEVGEKLKGISLNEVKIWRDDACNIKCKNGCDDDGDDECDECKRRHLSLFLTNEKNSPNRLCKVDALITKGKEVKVIIEIEESGFNPTKIHGKFLTSAFAKSYINVDGEKFEIKNNAVLFVQVIDYDKMLKALKNKENSTKEKQFNLFAEKINEMIEKTKYGSIKSYKLFFVKKNDKEKCLKDIIEHIQNFIK